MLITHLLEIYGPQNLLFRGRLPVPKMMQVEMQVGVYSVWGYDASEKDFNFTMEKVAKSVADDHLLISWGVAPALHKLVHKAEFNNDLLLGRVTAYVISHDGNDTYYSKIGM